MQGRDGTLHPYLYDFLTVFVKCVVCRVLSTSFPIYILLFSFIINRKSIHTLH